MGCHGKQRSVSAHKVEKKNRNFYLFEKQILILQNMHSLSVGLNDRRPTDLASCKVKENVSNELIISVHVGCQAIIFLGHFTHTFFKFCSLHLG